MRAGLLPTYAKQLREAGIDFTLREGASQYLTTGIGNGGDLRHKIEHVLFYAKLLKQHRYIVFTDAWDVLFYGTHAEVLEKLMKRDNGGLVMAAERGCWPDYYLGPHFPGTTPWRFVNGGLMAGTPQRLVEWVAWVKAHPAYLGEMIDQQWMGHRYLQGERVNVVLDERTELFHCVHGDHGELGFEDGKPVNLLCDTHPNFLHFCGGIDPMKYQLLAAMSKMKAAAAATTAKGGVYASSTGRVD